MKKTTVIAALLLMWAQWGLGQDFNVKVGQKVPDLNITDYLLNVPKDKNLSNKFKVIEFWATWCGPCLGAVPHLNELQAHFKDKKDLVFVSLSDEKPQKIQQTLKKVQFATFVASDQTQKSHRNLIMSGKEYSIPKTLLVDNQNVVRWLGTPELLTKDLIERFVKGESLEPKSSSPVTAQKSTATEEKQLAYTTMAYALYNNKNIPYTVIFSESNPEKDSGSASYFDVANANLMLFN